MRCQGYISLQFLNRNGELLWITITIAMIVIAWSQLMGVNTLPQVSLQLQAQGNITLIYDKGLEALEGNHSGALSLYTKVLTIDPYDTHTLSSIGL
jgi:hypothetical protein